MIPLLVLIPTEFERARLQPLIADDVGQKNGVIEICGFGPITAGIMTARLISKHQPRSVTLMGIAGSFGSELPIGSAVCFSRIACYGIGAGSGSRFCTAGELGWPLWPDAEPGQSFGDVIGISNDQNQTESGRLLLTACAASESADDVENRLRKFPDAVAEDMEAFSVVMACRTAGAQVSVVRGISNVAGDRNHANWNVTGALNAAAELFLSGCLL